MKLNLRILIVALWLAAVYALWRFLGSYVAPDACLDVLHGSFDYRTWECSSEQQPYIYTAVYAVPGFWLAALSLALAISVTVLVRRSRRSVVNS